MNRSRAQLANRSFARPFLYCWIRNKDGTEDITHAKCQDEDAPPPLCIIFSKYRDKNGLCLCIYYLQTKL